ncbi:MAG TPA: ANTAR domain-containing protein [Gaiellaceae bacterium]|nr:ANTAR domain-containing protein [Gaiellaceae bacterium]
MARADGGVDADVLQRLKALEAENHRLREALEGRNMLEQAKGAVSVRCGVDPDTASEMIRGLARSQRRELEEYATEIVANGGRFSVEC